MNITRVSEELEAFRREINKRTTRIENRVNDHGERIAAIEGRNQGETKR